LLLYQDIYDLEITGIEASHWLWWLIGCWMGGKLNNISDRTWI
jgi:hypothetical protein